MPASVPRPARPEELPRAFALVFAHLAPSERDYRVARALELVKQGELDPAGILVLPEATGLAGVLICHPVPGAGALIWPPTVAAGEARHDKQDVLVRHACAWLGEKGARLAQCLLGDDETAQAVPLLRNGFAHVTGLTYMRHDLRARESEAVLPLPQLSFIPYNPAQPHEFHATLTQTYEGTLDCPEVNGVRTVEEVIQGHQAQGHFDPSRWWLVRLSGQPAGVLLLMELFADEWEVAYVGIVPASRRRGVGRHILRHGLAQARAGGAATVTLSVDDRNLPARALYEQLGFAAYDHRQVFLSVWGRAL
jgi:mycothiol synthase